MRFFDTPKHKYADWLHSDCGNSFAEWLGIDKPIYDYGWSWENRDKVRMRSSIVTGEWRTTKKNAKASYKAALKEYRQRCATLNKH